MRPRAAEKGNQERRAKRLELKGGKEERSDEPKAA